LNQKIRLRVVLKGLRNRSRGGDESVAGWSSREPL